MINVKELSVGDVVSYGGLYCTVKRIGEVVSLDTGKGTEFVLEPRYIEPVQITEEILVKNGFAVHPFGCVWYQEKGIDFQNYIIVYFRRNGEVRKVEMDFVNKIRAEYRDIYFVHQLQHELRRIGKEITL